MVWRPRLRTILFLVNIIILALPLGGIVVLRLYESALVRQTETELIAQAAFVSASYKTTFSRRLSRSSGHIGKIKHYGLELSPEWANQQFVDSRWRPRPATLDLATDRIRPRPGDAITTNSGPDALAEVVGQEITSVLLQAQIITLASIRVVDYKGIIVASTANETHVSLADREEIQRALRGEYVSLLRSRVSDEPTPALLSMSRGAGVRVFVALPIIMDGRILGAVMLSRTPANITQALYHKRYLLLGGVLTLLFVVLLVSLFISYAISRPLHAVIQQTERAARGEKGAVMPLENPVTREIAQLSEAVARMANTLEQRAAYISDFASHVSHEFKTPLTAIQGAAELLRDHATSMSDEERQRFVQNLLDDSERLDKLVKRLLELARADVIEVGADTTDAMVLLQGLVQRYHDIGANISLEQADTALSTTHVAMATETLESILVNLIDNARQHAGQNAEIRIKLWQKVIEGDNTLRITLQDNGPGISPANAKRVFEPFFTTARDSGGTGLGLAVVQSLLRAHQATIQLLPSERGAIFEIDLPLTPAA